MIGGALCVCLTLASTGTVTSVAAGADRRAPRRPDLTVLARSLSVRAGRLSASFSVSNVGTTRAGRSSASLSIRLGRRRWVVRTNAIGALHAGRSARVSVNIALPTRLPAGLFWVWACADSRGVIRERSERDNCARLGSFRITPGTHTPPPERPTVPSHPVAYTADTPQHLTGTADYWFDVPPSYDATGHTPITLFVWLHGCGGEASGDIYTVDPGSDRAYITITVGGREDGCWDPNVDVPKVLAAIADVETHFNINPRRVIIGGYSSGGDLAYRTIFLHAREFAGLLAENTSPFRDTGMTGPQLMAAAAWKFPVVHLAHLQDATYPFDPGVKQEVAAIQSAGFPVTLLTAPGDHWDNPGEHGLPGTDADTVNLLLPHIGDGWLAPA